MTRLSIRSLGTLRIAVDAAPLTGLDSDKARALLTYLALESDRVHRRESLVGLFWPDYPERRARHTLSQVLSNLRQSLGDRTAAPSAQFIDVTHHTLQFCRSSDYWLDVEQFNAARETARDPSTDGRAITALEQALALYRGPFLDGFSLPGSPAFEEWLLLQRERLERTYSDILAALIETCAAQHNDEQALRYARQQLDLDPWREDAHRQLMRLLALSGQRSAAIAQYDACCRILRDELGLVPEAETTDLLNRIKAGVLVPAAHMSTARLLPRTPPPHNLPAALTPLIGRKDELGELQRRLRDPGCRLLTLFGPGGIGKTRLALEAARALVPGFEHGVFLVSLAPLQDPQGIVATIAQAIGLAFSDQGSPQEGQLCRYLQNKTLLLLLDNAEHLLREATAQHPTCQAIEIMSDILSAAPKVKMLVTSRVRLNMLGEYIMPVRELAYPDGTRQSLAALQSLDTVQLFVQSAQRVRSGFTLMDRNCTAVATICRYVQGHPLAVLLIAAWMATLPATEVAVRLGREPVSHSHNLDLLEANWQNVPIRHRSLRAVFEHSWHLLAQHQRDILQALSAFRGGFTKRAALEIARARPEDLEVLVNASFLVCESSGRYTIHELLRQFAEEKLAQSPETYQEANDRHCGYFVASLQNWGDSLLGPQQLDAIEEMDADIDNVRKAWEWAISQRSASWLEGGSAGLGRYLRWRAYHTEGVKVFETMPGQFDDGFKQEYPDVFAQLLTWAGLFNQMGGNIAQATDCLQHALELYELPSVPSQPAKLGKARALLQLAHIIRPTDPVRAISFGQESIEHYRTLDARTELAEALYVVGEILGYAGQVATAIQYQEESLCIRRQVQDYRGIADSLRLISYVQTNIGNLQDAVQLAQESCELRAKIGDPTGTVIGLYTLGTALFGLGQFDKSIDALLQSVRQSEQLGLHDGLVEPVIHLSLVYALAGQFDSARRYANSALETVSLIENLRSIGYARFVLGMVALGEQRYEDARKWLADGITALENHSGGGEVEMTRTWLVIALWLLGQHKEARVECVRVLEAYIQQNIAPFMVRIATLPAMALVCLDNKEYEKAIELYAFARVFAMLTNIRWLDDSIREPLDQAAATLPPDVVEAAQARGRARELGATMVELLAGIKAREQ